MWRRRILGGKALLGTALLGAASAIFLSCSSSTPTDINIGSDAGKNFDIPAREIAPDTVVGTGGAGGDTGTGGVTGTGAGGASGAGGTDDAGIDAGGVDAGGVDAGGVDAGGTGGTVLLTSPQYQHPNRPPRTGAA